MLTKTFKAETMLKALQMVQEELGANAIVISTREIPAGSAWNPWKQASVEIIATISESLPENQKPAQVPVLRPASNKKEIEFIEQIPEIEWVNEPVKKSFKSSSRSINPAMRDPKQSETIASETGDTNPIANPAETQTRVQHTPRSSQKTASKNIVFKTGFNESELPPVLRKIQQQLFNQGVDNMLVEGLMNVSIETLSPNTLADAETCKKYITQLLGAELRVQQGSGVYLSSNVVCLIGASGSGKTGSIAKLALYFSQKLNKTITWICADTVRIGAIAEARAFTDALGMKLKLVYAPLDIKEIIADPREDDLFLVDTPSYNPCSESQMVELGALLSEFPKRCTYMVAPATTKETDLFELSASLGLFNLDGLIITKLDETHTFGNVYNFARKNPIPLSFFTTGTEPARHLEVVDPARLVAALLGKEWAK